MLDQILDKLKSQYQVLCFQDLGLVNQSHGFIFDLLRSLRKDQFESDQRLIFYTAFNPDQLLIDHLQRAAARIDISNFFIIVCCPYDISKKLKIANQQHGYDNVEISWHDAKIAQSLSLDRPGFVPNDTRCVVPFGMLSVPNTRKVRPCCKYGSIVADLAQESLDQIMHNDHLQRLRQNLKQGVRVKECQICWDVESTGGTSMRQNLLSKWQDEADLSWYDDPQVRLLSFGASSLCNFKCRICEPAVSSQYAAEELRFEKDPLRIPILQEYLRRGVWDDDDTIIEQFRTIYPHLRAFSIAGGEPFLLTKLPVLLKDLIDSGHSSHVNLEIITNASIWKSDIIDLFDRFESVEIGLSIDNVGKRFELERGGSWDDIKANCEKYSSLSNGNIKCTIITTINVQNILYLDELLEFSSEINLPVAWTYLESPDFLCIDNMTSSAKHLAKEKYQNHSNPELSSIASRMDTGIAKNDDKFIEYMEKLDSRRGQDSWITHKEIMAAMMS